MQKQKLFAPLPANDWELTGQSTHVLLLDAPTTAEYLPSLHSVQPALPRSALNLPATHRVHAPTPGAAVLRSRLPPKLRVAPAMHVHSVLPAAESEFALQSSQILDARTEENFPGAQSEHGSVPPTDDLNLPAAQSTHSADPVDALYFPASHAEHASCTPVYPALQTHSLLPASACESKGHSWQRRAAKTLENSPAGHISQGPDPTLFLYLPGVHAEHEPPVPVYPASHLQAVLPASELE